jgi:hypothetical protein
MCPCSYLRGHVVCQFTSQHELQLLQRLRQETECKAYAASLKCLQKIKSRCECEEKIKEEEGQRKYHYCAEKGW